MPCICCTSSRSKSRYARRHFTIGWVFSHVILINSMHFYSSLIYTRIYMYITPSFHTYYFRIKPLFIQPADAFFKSNYVWLSFFILCIFFFGAFTLPEVKNCANPYIQLKFLLCAVVIYKINSTFINFVLFSSSLLLLFSIFLNA